MLEDIKKIERHTFRHGFEDGIFEIVFGAFFLLHGLYFIVLGLTPKMSVRFFAPVIGYLLLIFLGFLLFKKAMRSLKEKWAWPRTGYVSYRESRQSRLKAGIRGGIAGFCTPIASDLIKAIFSKTIPIFSPFTVISGFLFAAFFFWLGLRSGLVRFAFVGGISAAVGLICSLLTMNRNYSMSIFFSGIGIVLIAGGWIASRRFLHSHPLPAEDPR